MRNKLDILSFFGPVLILIVMFLIALIIDMSVQEHESTSTRRNSITCYSNGKIIFSSTVIDYEKNFNTHIFLDESSKTKMRINAECLVTEIKE